MKSQFVLAFLIIAAALPLPARADTIVRTIIEFFDDAEEDVTGPDAGNVRRMSSDLEIGNENGILQWVGLRFQNIVIPSDSTINSATIRFTGVETDAGSLVIPIFGELSLNPDEFSDATPLTGRTLTLASVVWDMDPWFPGNSGVNTTTPTLATIVQEIVDQNGWAPGTGIVFLILNDPLDTSERLAVSFDGNPLQAAVLTIDFSPGDVVLPGDVNLDGVLNLLDVAPFVERLSTGTYQIEADINQDGMVNLLDVGPFVTLLTG